MSEFETAAELRLERTTLEATTYTWIRKLVLVGATILLIAQGCGLIFVLLNAFLDFIPIYNDRLTYGLFILSVFFEIANTHIILFSFIVLGIGFQRYSTLQQDQKSRKYAIAAVIVLFSLFIFQIYEYAYWFFILPALKTVPLVISETTQILTLLLPQILISIAIILFGISCRQSETMRTQKKLLYVTPVILLVTIGINCLGTIPANLATIYSAFWVIGEAITEFGFYAIYIGGVALAIEFLVKTLRLKPTIIFVE